MLTQRSYIDDVLEYHNMTDRNSAVSPIDPGIFVEISKIEKGTANQKEIDYPYREIIGQILYLATKTRPDVSFAVSILSQCVAHPRECHWKGIKRILRCLRGTQNLCLNLTPSSTLLTASADSIFASTDDRK